MNKYNTAVIGAGPAGMMAAIIASQNGKRVALIEKNAQPGRKLLATGNGRCNLTNKYISTGRYHGASPEFIKTVLGQFNQTAAMKFFNNLGLVLKEEDNGRIFPRTNQSSSVAEVMRLALVEHGVHILLNTQVKAIERQGVWKVLLNNQSALKTDSLIIATGGRAAHYLGSTGDGLYWAQKLGHSLTPIHAALVPMETVETWPKEIQGIKVEAGIRATSNDNKIGETTGDLLFTSYGVSGTAAMALAGSIAPLLKTSRVRLHIDLFPDMTKEELDLIILHIFQNAGKRTLRGSLIGLLPDRIIPVVARFAKLDEHKQAGKISHANRLEIVRVLKDITLTVSKLRPLKEAQVTAGGIDTREIKPQSLESKLMKGLYFAGEIIDVDGDSGGFNLQWAWSSGHLAGMSAE